MVHLPDHLRVDVGCQAQVSQSIVKVSVGPALYQNDFGFESSNSFRKHISECFEVCLVAGRWRKGNVELQSFRLSLPYFVRKPCTREEEVSTLVKVDVEDCRVLVIAVPDAISMVSVDIQIHQPLRLETSLEIGDHDCRIVEDAES